jgi:hypothetical protein
MRRLGHQNDSGVAKDIKLQRWSLTSDNRRRVVTNLKKKKSRERKNLGK